MPLPFDSLALRAAFAAIVATVVALVAGPSLIRVLARFAAEPNHSDSARLRELHRAKEATPGMGGILILAAAAIAVALFVDLRASWMPALGVMVAGLAALGAVDDLIKVRGGSKGLSARAKLAGQWIVALATAALLYRAHQAEAPDALALRIPGVDVPIMLGLWFVPLTALMIVGFSNAVNLTDGLDGLAAGCSLSALAVVGLAAWAAAAPRWATVLRLPQVPGAGELAVPAAAMIGALAGFLAFNRHPARVFMGDTGSLPLGGLLGFFAAALRQEWLVLVAGGVFVTEAASVVIQVTSYRLRRKRVFRCAPLHHHFQFLGWPEQKVVARFWMASVLLAVLAIGGSAVFASVNNTLNGVPHTFFAPAGPAPVERMMHGYGATSIHDAFSSSPPASRRWSE